MKLIKLAIISVVILFLLVTGISLLLPSTVLVSRAVNVSAPTDSIIPLIKNIEQWSKWIEGMKKPEVKIYDSLHANLAGTIVQITNISDSIIVTTWRSRSGNMQTATFHLITAPSQHLTIVQWQFEQKLNWYPWEKFGSIMNDKILGTMMEKNLGNLKLIVENK